MITPDQFFGKYDGKGIDFDNYYGFQCMDLYRQFVKECLEFPQSPPVTGAKDVWDTYLQDKFIRILNTIEAVPIKGDIVIWGTGAGPYGHIAICKDGTQAEFTSFEQNWPVGSLCHFQKHNYNNVLGWLRVKPPIEPPPPVVCPPDLSGEVVALKNKIDQLNEDFFRLSSENMDLTDIIDSAKEIIYGRGFIWSKQAKLKVLLPK